MPLTKMRDFSRPPKRRSGFIKKTLRTLVFLLGLTLLSSGAVVAYALKNLPSPEDLFARRVIESTKIFDRSGGVLLFEIHGEEKRTVIPFGEIPPAVKNATIAIEDANFYQHRGIDFRGIARALVKDILSGDFRQGGSTITQQLIKNSLLGHERTIVRKAREALLAVAFESRFDKDKILELYLNQIPYGQNAYGIEAAAQTFFGKHARDLGAAEAALLGALPRAPSYYSPYGQHKDELFKRKDAIIERERELGYLSAEEASYAKKETLKLLPAAKNIRAPHFVMFVRDYLARRYGEDEIEKGGLIVTTTLDWRLQEEAERLVKENSEKNEKLIKARNMALVAVNPKNGEVLAMVGSRDYFDIERDGNFNVATALRQPGSAFKPFVYATAFKKGFTPDAVLFDLPTEFNPACTPEGRPRPGSNLDPEDCYHPQNYDEKFRGPVTLRNALGASLNLPSVKLLYLAGVEDSIRTAEAMGITSLSERERFGLSLVLGGAEVKLLEMANAFGVFANDGVANPPQAILKVETTGGRILEEKKDSPRPVLDPEVARTINDVLSDDGARAPTFIPHSSLYFPDRQVAAKTGTTQDYRDAWTIGYTPSLVAGVWAGNNDNSPMRQKGSGVLAAAPTWRSFMALALKDSLPEEFPVPSPQENAKPILRGVWQGNAVVTIDAISQKRATDMTPPELRKDVAYGEPHDPLYWLDRSDPSGPPPQNPADDLQYANWEWAFQIWLKQSSLVFRSLSAIPKDYDDVHTAEKRPRLTVEKTADANGNLILAVRVSSVFPIKQALLSTSERVFESKNAPPSSFSFFLSKKELDNLTSGAPEIRVYDSVGNIASYEVLF